MRTENEIIKNVLDVAEARDDVRAVIRTELLNKMVSRYLYLRDGEPVDVGILNCRFEKLLEEDLFLLYKKTYPDADYEHMWQAYTAVTELWNRLGRTVAEKRGFSYPEETEKNMLEFIRELRRPR